MVALSRKVCSSVVLKGGLLLGSLTLAGCLGQSPAPPATGGFLPPLLGGGGASSVSATSAPGNPTGPVALLLPLSGPLQPIGQVLENAAKLAITGTSPTLDVRDTGGTAQGAASAAQAAIAAGDGLILGPLTSAEAHAVAPIAQAAHISMLAFTNDDSVAAPGVWALGITPSQQVQRVVQASVGAGHGQIAALLPDTVFGHSLGTALQAQSASLSGGNGPNITFYEAGFSGLNQAIQSVSDFSDRGQGLMEQIKAAQDLGTAAGRAQATQLQHQPIPPPAFNALFIGATQPEDLAEIASLLPYYSVSAPQVQLLGPALWANVATRLGGNGVYNGALYAAPDPAAAASFYTKYQGAYGSAPPAIADVAFDAAAIAQLLAGQGGYSLPALTNPAGFGGTDGVLQLDPNGQVQRGLAVFQVAPGGAVINSAAPATLPAPSS